MNSSKVIKKIYNLARYDFIQNLENFLLLTGILTTVMTVLYFLSCLILKNYTCALWYTPLALLTDIACKKNGCIDLLPNYYWAHILAGIMIGCIFLYGKIVVIKNCLDLAFDSTMSGFSITWHKNYIWLLVLLIPLIGNQNAFLHSKDWYQDKIAILVFFIGTYIAQIIYLWTMHIIEYKKGFWDSQKEIFQLAYDNRLLLKILILQLITSLTGFLIIFYAAQPIVDFGAHLILWLFFMINVPISDFITTVIHNFFYTWMYLLLFAWICLVWAHVYRQLICPPIDNPSCSSCLNCN